MFRRFLDRIAAHFTVEAPRALPIHVGSNHNYIRAVSIDHRRAPAWVLWLHRYLRKHYG